MAPGARWQWRTCVSRRTRFATPLSTRARRRAFPRSTDFNGARQEGAGYFQLTNRNGRRCSSAVAFLRPIRARPNLTVITNALVHGLELEGKRATGVRYARNGQVETAAAAREVVLAAGAVGSPHILELSGIGSGAVLKAAGVPVRHELAGVAGAGHPGRGNTLPHLVRFGIC